MSSTGLCGGSASGKTTVARKIIEALDVPWVVLLSMDSFYKVRMFTHYVWIVLHHFVCSLASADRCCNVGLYLTEKLPDWFVCAFLHINQIL